MIKILLIFVIIFGVQLELGAQESKGLYTIYLVRHSEKDINSINYSDPLLTECGVQRSVNLSNFLRDVNIEVIYSTDFKRTKSTAGPTATAKGLEIKLYADNELENLSNILIKDKKNALVVGHSYTTAVLAGLLIGEEMDAFGLNIYNRIYKVVFYENEGQLHLLHTTFDCIE